MGSPAKPVRQKEDRMKKTLICCFLLISCSVGKPQGGCDPIFDKCDQDCDPIFETCSDGGGDDPVDEDENCFESQEDIDEAIFAGDTRQAFNDCDKQKKCEDYAKYGYACAPSVTCQNSTIITWGRGLIDLRTSDRTCARKGGIIDVSDTKCDKTDYVCCRRPNFKVKKCPLEKATPFDECGRTGSSVIVTGEKSDKNTAQPGEFPHMCIVYKIERNQRAYVAGATLIGRNKVITVAHKIHVVKTGESVDYRNEVGKFSVRCGEHNVKTEDDILDSQESRVAEVIFHPEYNAKNVRNNLAILRTEENFVYQEHIGRVCLPSPNENFDNERNCFSSGWGKDDFTSYGRFSDALKKVQMPVVPTAACEQRLKSHPRLKNKPSLRVDESWVCIGGERGADTCTGDGGSPHVCKNSDDQWVQVGAVAWGLGCGDDVPAIYSSIPAAMCWVDWMMSCIPLAEKDIDLTDSDDFDLRQVGDSVKSVNNVSADDCQEWLENNDDLARRCQVDYEELDTRRGKR